MFSGRKVQVGLGKETVRGTAVAPSFWIPKYEAAVDNKREYVNDEASVGVIAESTGAVVAKEWAEGEITGKIGDKSAGLILLGALGAVSDSTVETGVYAHEFTLQNGNAHQSLTIEMKDHVQQLKYALGVVESLKLSVETGKIAEFSAAFKAKKGASAANSPSYVTENLFVGRHASLKLAADLAGLDAASAINVKNVEISIEKDVEAHDALGSGEPVNFANKTIKISGNIEAIYENATDFKSPFEDGTLKAMRISLVNTDVTIGAASNPTLEIDLAKVSLQEWSRKSSNKDIVSQTIKFEGHYSLGDSKIAVITLTNTQASY